MCATTNRFFKTNDGVEHYRNTACFAQFYSDDVWSRKEKVTRIGFQYEGSYYHQSRDKNDPTAKYTQEYFDLLVRCKEVIPSLKILNLEYREKNTYQNVEPNRVRDFEPEDTPLFWVRTTVKTDKAMFNFFIARQLCREIFEIKDILDRLGIDPYMEENKEAFQAVLFLKISYYMKWDKIQRSFHLNTKGMQAYGMISNCHEVSLFSFSKFVKGNYDYFLKPIKETKCQYDIYQLGKEEVMMLTSYNGVKGLHSILSQGESNKNHSNPTFGMRDLDGKHNLKAMKDIVIRMVNFLEEYTSSPVKK